MVVFAQTLKEEGAILRLKISKTAIENKVVKIDFRQNFTTENNGLPKATSGYERSKVAKARATNTTDNVSEDWFWDVCHVRLQNMSRVL